MTTLAAPLVDAYLRVARGAEHLLELKTLHDAVCEAQAKATIVKQEPGGLILPGKMAKVLSVDSSVRAPIPDRCRILVGDAVNCYRAALNYLTVDLERLDSGNVGEQTQFPIHSTPDGFQSNARRLIGGLNPAHVAAIERLQPYNGCDWTSWLADLSNVDKHRNLVFVVHDMLVSGTVTTEPTTDGQPIKFSMEMKLQPVLRIALDEGGLPLVETLQSIESQVAQTLDAFKPEFQ
jgi:hypothetical protein